jgi:hypothetical protein
LIHVNGKNRSAPKVCSPCILSGKENNMMLRYALVGLSAAVVVGVTFIPDDALAARYSGARTAHYARTGTAVHPYRGAAIGVTGRGYRAAAYHGAAYRGYGYRGAYRAAAVGAAAVGAAAVAATSPWGYPYGGWGWGYGSGGYGTGGYYGAYASGYPSYYGGGVYANRSYVTGRPTLFPRYYGGAWTGY